MDIRAIILAATETVAQEAGEGGILGTLGINWKLFLAQLINFGIVLFVFWKWIVKPLGKTLTARQERIERGLKNTEATEAEKKRFDEWKQQEMKKVRSEADHVLRTASDSANKIKQETIFDAQKQADKILVLAAAAIEAEKDKMLKEARTELASLVILVSEKVIKEKLDATKDRELIEDSIKSLE